MKQLGDILLEGGLVNPTQLELAYAEQERVGRALGRVLIEQGVLTESQLVSALATQIGLRFVDLSDFPVDGSAIGRIPGPVCRRHAAMPIGFEDGKLLVAMADPANVFAIDDIRSLTGMDVKPVVATRGDVAAAIDRYYRADSDLDDISAVLDAQEEEDELSKVKEIVEDAPIVKYVNLLITQAIQDRASDIHLEPTETDLRVRFRIDGVLHEVMRSPKAIQSGVISRLKIMADINIAERRIPQDGRLSVNAHGRKIDLRVATLPTVWGEKVVMRILDNSTARLDLTDLGFSEDNYERYSRSFTKPYGMILVTGPTGSGKSTTLYATLNIVSRPEVNVITVEDPVEYRLPGINQVQTNNKAGLTFASALRSILRSDPDIVLIGEIRDHETGQIAVEAALTGHLVLSTLHTNDAPSAVTRLTEMGIEPFLVGSALDAVLAQRLARRLCVKCKEAYTPTRESLVASRFPWSDDKPLPELFRPIGCSACAKTGYKGRLALHEVMIVSEEVERLAVERASATVISQVARERGHADAAGRRAGQGPRGRHIDGRDPPGRRLKAWQGRPPGSSQGPTRPILRENRCARRPRATGAERGQHVETSGYQPVPSEPGGFTSMPVPVPEEEAPAGEGWTYSSSADARARGRGAAGRHRLLRRAARCFRRARPFAEPVSFAEPVAYAEAAAFAEPVPPAEPAADPLGRRVRPGAVERPGAGTPALRAARAGRPGGELASPLVAAFAGEVVTLRGGRVLRADRRVGGRGVGLPARLHRGGG